MMGVKPVITHPSAGQLYLNDIVEYEYQLDQQSLPTIQMPSLEYTSSKWERGD